MMLGITFTAGGSALFVTTMTSLVSKQAGPREQGLVMGVYQSGSWMGRSVGPPMSGILFEVGIQLPLIVAGLILMPCLALLSGIFRRIQSTEESGPE
jgi:MFS family permease